MGDAGDHALEQIGRLGERDGALGLVRRAQTRVGSLVGAAGSEKVIRDRHCASARSEERVGGARVDPLPLRDDRVGGDRLLGQRVAPAVAAARVRALLQELQGDGRFEGREDNVLAGLGHVDEQAVLE